MNFTLKQTYRIYSNLLMKISLSLEGNHLERKLTFVLVLIKVEYVKQYMRADLLIKLILRISMLSERHF